jgi:hypothetical protein
MSGWLICFTSLSRGFRVWLGRYTHTPEGPHHRGVKLSLAGVTLLASTYSMVFLEPKDPVRLRWLGEQIRAGRAYGVSGAGLLDAELPQPSRWDWCWRLMGGKQQRFADGAGGAGLSHRDVAIFVLMQGRAGGRAISRLWPF